MCRSASNWWWGCLWHRHVAFWQANTATGTVEAEAKQRNAGILWYSMTRQALHQLNADLKTAMHATQPACQCEGPVEQPSRPRCKRPPQVEQEAGEDPWPLPFPYWRRLVASVFMGGTLRLLALHPYTSRPRLLAEPACHRDGDRRAI